MCQYSALEGVPGDWHFVHLGSRAVGGAGMVVAEATAVSAEGRISPGDTGLWNETQAQAFAKIASFIRANGAVAGVQLAHAGRKASTDVPWRGNQSLTNENGGWQTIAPSAIPFSEKSPVPREMNLSDLERVVGDFRASALRALASGFEVIELHMAHGYLLHEFLSPLTNHRTDDYGGSLEKRMAFPLRVVRAVREVWPEELPLLVRISASDWCEGGWDLTDSIALAKKLHTEGVDLIDCSSGGAIPHVKIPVAPGYQVTFAAEIRRATGIPTGAVGLITEPEQAETILASQSADAVFLAREVLRQPYWPLIAAQRLKAEIAWPVQYERARPVVSP